MDEFLSKPDKEVSVRDIFGIDSDMRVPAFSKPGSYVPERDSCYYFDKQTTLAILAGFAFNRRVMVQGYHGTGKSTHIEQVASRLNWPCVRINLDSHISRLDLVGKDVIKLSEGQPVTEFHEGILPWGLQNPIALCFDEYDAGRPDVMFVIQRVLEAGGKLTLLDQSRILTPHPFFRLFATANTIGLGDVSGLYHGTQIINQGQMDRWNIVVCLNYLSLEKEVAIIVGKCAEYEKNKNGIETIQHMVSMAQMTRNGFMNGDLSIVMSPRTVLSWAENATIFGDIVFAFHISFYNKCDPSEQPILCEYYQRCFGVDLLARTV